MIFCSPLYRFVVLYSRSFVVVGNSKIVIFILNLYKKYAKERKLGWVCPPQFIPRMDPDSLLIKSGKHDFHVQGYKVQFPCSLSKSSQNLKKIKLFIKPPKLWCCCSWNKKFSFFSFFQLEGIMIMVNILRYSINMEKCLYDTVLSHI